MTNYIQKLKEKTKAPSKFFEIVNDLLDKLIEFGYISKRQKKKLEKKLFLNIDTIIFADQKRIDYKSGYYDAVKKELYIKDIKNIESVYLRVIYALTTKISTNNTNYVGYSINNLSKTSYKIEYKYYGLNRAICSNLICRLLYTEPTTLSIMPTYRTYENDFLGRKIVADNDIYFLETKLLNQICYIFDLNAEKLYSNLFLNPAKYLKKFFNKIGDDYKITVLNHLDIISKKYANYNKLSYLNKALNDNYKKIKIKVLNSDIKLLEKEKEKINLAIRNALIPLNKNFDNDENSDNLDINIESCLSETIFSLESEIIEDLKSLQLTFINYLLSTPKKYSDIEFVMKLKTLQKISIVDNESLNLTIHEKIMENIIEKGDTTTPQIIEKIRYSLINYILSSSKFSNVLKDLKFNILSYPFDNTQKVLTCLSVDNTFMNLALIYNLEFSTKSINDNVTVFKIESLASILNKQSIIKDIYLYEKIFTSIKTKFPKFANVNASDIYVTNLDDKTISIVLLDNDFYILESFLKDDKETINTKIIIKEDPYYIFKMHYSNLPTVSKKSKEEYEN